MKQTAILIHDNYLMLPIGKHVRMRKVTVWLNGEMVDELDLRLDYINPSNWVPYDLRPYIGKTLTFGCEPDIEILDRQVSSPLPSDSQNLNYRPYIHFTPRHGWINDPNGLLEYTSPVTGKKVYHMFYQYNPYDTVWGNMHWGHAVSDDLLHWEELPIALFPDADGTMFSGSAVIDRENRTGLKEGDEDVILLYYTCAGHTSLRSAKKEFTQCLAYSTDGGVTFRKYANNPVIPHIVKDNRDPKVIWCEEMRRYVMALYLNDANFAIFGSDDLLHWDLIQKIVIEGEAECPDLFPLNADGNPKKRKWVISGASHYYIVCECRGGKFEQIQAPRRLSYGNYHYAAQTFSDVSDGRRICIAWNRNLEFPRAPFNGQMSIPLELTLRSRGGEYDLCANPIREVETLVAEEQCLREPEFSAQKPLEFPLLPAVYRIRLNMGRQNPDFSLTIFGQTVRVEGQKNHVQVGNSTFPLSMDNEDRRLTILVDGCSIELFAGDGQAIMTAPMLCDYNLKKLILTADSPVKPERLDIARLNRTTPPEQK